MVTGVACGDVDRRQNEQPIVSDDDVNEAVSPAELTVRRLWDALNVEVAKEPTERDLYALQQFFVPEARERSAGLVSSYEAFRLLSGDETIIRSSVHALEGAEGLVQVIECRLSHQELIDYESDETIEEDSQYSFTYTLVEVDGEMKIRDYVNTGGC